MAFERALKLFAYDKKFLRMTEIFKVNHRKFFPWGRFQPKFKEKVSKFENSVDLIEILKTFIRSMEIYENQTQWEQFSIMNNILRYENKLMNFPGLLNSSPQKFRNIFFPHQLPHFTILPWIISVNEGCRWSFIFVCVIHKKYLCHLLERFWWIS